MFVNLQIIAGAQVLEHPVVPIFSKDIVDVTHLYNEPVNNKTSEGKTSKIKEMVSQSGEHFG